jgi:hypothetical protein
MVGYWRRGSVASPEKAATKKGRRTLIAKTTSSHLHLVQAPMKIVDTCAQ